MIGTLLRIGWTNLTRDRVAQSLTFLLPIIFFSSFIRRSFAIVRATNEACGLYTADTIGFGWVPVGEGWNAEKDEITFLVTKPGVQPKITADLSIDVAISDIDTIKGRPARHILANMSGVVQGILVATERECRRLFKFD
ncbi:hypothetical protein B4Q13_18965 [Lacticaseibacillus rhamnosus]